MKKSFLFIAFSRQQPKDIYSDPSVWYRCYQPAKAFRELGHYASVVSHENVSLEHIRSHGHIVFFRPVYSEKMVDLIRLCEKEQKSYYASYDDLFFDIGQLKNSGFRKLFAPQEQILSERPELHAKAFYFFDKFIASTEGLKKSILKHKPNAKVYLHYNGIPPEFSEWVKFLSKRAKEERLIGYFAGGAIHSHDLEKISLALKEVLIEQDAKFLCVETVDVPEALLETGRVIKIPRMNYTGMVHACYRCTTTIAPLELNEFTNSKSGIKFLESAILGNKVVATPIIDMLRVGNEFMFPAVTLSDWYIQLNNALKSKFSKEDMHKNHLHLKRNFSTKAEAEKFFYELSI